MGRPVPFVVAADGQTAGRGTGLRQWLSPPGGLYFTVSLPVGAAPTFAGFALGVAAVETLRVHHAHVGLKWPNDVLLGNADGSHGKLAGILGEAAGDAIHVGIGINLTTPRTALTVPEGEAPFPPATLAGTAVGAPERIVLAIAERTMGLWQSVLRGETAALLRQWEKFCVHRDRSVTFREPDGSTFDGRFLGLADDGAAWVAAKGERRTFYAGELRCFW